MTLQVRTVDAEVVEGDALTIDAALVPYVSQADELRALVRKLSAHAATAAVVTVRTPDDKAYAVKVMRAMRADRAEVEPFFRPIKQSIDRVKKIALDMERYALALVDGPVAVITGRVTTFDRQVAEEAEARRQALLAAERRRLEDEAAALRAREAEAAEIAALLAAHFGEPPVELPEPSEPEPISEELLELAAVAAAPAATATDVDGFWYQDVVNVAVDDLRALVKAVAAGDVPIEAIAADESFIKKRAGAMGVDLGYPGVRVWTTKEPRVRKA